MSVGDRVRNPETKGYAAFEVTDETVTNGEMQVAMLVKAVGDDGATVALTSIVTAVQGTLTANIAALPKSSTSNTPSIATASGTVISANASRKLWSIQNVGTNPLFVRLGASASTTVFHFILKGGTADSDGNGAVITDDCYTGVVSVAGTSPKYTVTELT